MQTQAGNHGRSFRTSRWMLPSAVFILIALVLYPAQLLIILFVIPMLMITMIVAAPFLLPFVTLLCGAYWVTEVIHTIHREKHQHTYDLMCASPEGALYANWSCATGLLHRGAWFSGLRWGTRQSTRLGLLVLGGMTVLTLWLILSDFRSVGLEQLRLLLLLLLLCALYHTNLRQSLLLSLITGLYASSFDWARRDTTLVGMLMYVFALSLPFAVALLCYVSCSRLAVDALPLVTIGIECSSLLLIVLVREMIITLLWQGLRHRLNSSAVRARHHLELSLFRTAWLR